MIAAVSGWGEQWGAIRHQIGLGPTPSGPGPFASPPPSLRHRIGYEGAMGFGPKYRCIIGVLAAWLACSLVAFAAAPADPAAMAQYYGLLEQYNRLHAPYAAAASAYWSSISEKRKLRNTKRASGENVSLDDYVLAQPPVYTGPPKPRNPALPPPPAPPRVPVVADFLAAALAEFSSVRGCRQATATSSLLTRLWPRRLD